MLGRKIQTHLRCGAQKDLVLHIKQQQETIFFTAHRAQKKNKKPRNKCNHAASLYLEKQKSHGMCISPVYVYIYYIVSMRPSTFPLAAAKKKQITKGTAHKVNLLNICSEKYMLVVAIAYVSGGQRSVNNRTPIRASQVPKYINELNITSRLCF